MAIIKIPILDANNVVREVAFESSPEGLRPVHKIAGVVFTQSAGSSLTEPPTVGEVTLAASGLALELKAGATALGGRRQLILYPPEAGSVYWGPGTVTSATGAPLVAGSSPVVFPFDGSAPIAVYACSDGTERAVRVVESK